MGFLKDLNNNFLYIGFCLATTLVMSGCAANDGNNKDGGGDGSDKTTKSSFTLDARTNTRGIAEVSFNLPKGTSKLGVTTITADQNNSITFDRFVDSEGSNFLPSVRNSQISLAVTPITSVNTAVAPSRAADPALVDDSKYTVRVQLSDGVIEDKLVKFAITSKVDGSLTRGRLLVNLIYVGKIGGSEVAISTIRKASDVFSSIYANAGINVDFTEQSIDGQNVIESPFDGSSFIENVSNNFKNGGINILIAGDINKPRFLGVSGGIPGPLFPSRKSAIVLSLVNAAGSDGDFSNEDIRILGETMAHESGHYLGLFHPVDLSNSIVSGEDPLSDTPVCSALTDCVLVDELVSNLMFFKSIQREDGSFVKQQFLTAQQQGVLNRNPLVD